MDNNQYTLEQLLLYAKWIQEPIHYIIFEFEKLRPIGYEDTL